MQEHTKIYLKGCGYTDTCFVSSEISNQRAVDTHHIISRGRGGDNRLENLMALTREEHLTFGDKNQYMVFLLNIHRAFLKNRGVKFNNDWFEDKIKHYNTTHLFI